MSICRSGFKLPPRELNWNGEPRRVGVEIEFAAVSAHEGAVEVRSLFGGSIEPDDPHFFRIVGTPLGDFQAKLDSRYAHRSEHTDGEDESEIAALIRDLPDLLREIYGDISSLVVPCEIACPSVPIADLDRISDLVDHLIQSGAQGTGSSPFYACGAQFNPDVATCDPEWIMAVLKAELLLSDWLRAVMRIDLTRRILAFAQPFGTDYVQRVVRPDYWPDQDRMIDDYLKYNPSRNRELDLLPLFSWLDGERVRNVVCDSRIKARPAFHYRLPNANLGTPGWDLCVEWNRWCVVERLAEDRSTLDAMGRAFSENADKWLPEDWAIRASEWLIV